MRCVAALVLAGICSRTRTFSFSHGSRNLWTACWLFCHSARGGLDGWRALVKSRAYPVMTVACGRISCCRIYSPPSVEELRQDY